MVDTFRCARAAVYHNTRRLTPAQIRAETGCSHVINGYFFNGAFQPLCWTIVDGTIISRDRYTDWGFGCGRSGAPVMTKDRTLGDYLSGVPILKDGKRLARELAVDVARRAERTAVGWKENGELVLWCDKTALTREQLQTKLLALHCRDALMLDGGGSTQGAFPAGCVTSSRKVPTFLLFWETENETKGEKPMAEVQTYSLKKDGAKHLTRHFQVKEFACKDGTDTVLVARALPLVCEYIRMRCGRAITVSSGYRTAEHNRNVGGAEYSQHLYGTAADLKTPAGFTPKQMAAIAREIMPDWGGVGVYDWGIHVDVRVEKADW